MSAPRRSAPTPPEEDEIQGASANERILSAAKEDNEEVYEDAIKEAHDINHQDGLGNTALHYAVLHQSLSILDHLLTHEECDVDIQNRVQRDTPLHLAIKVEEGDGRFGLREYLATQLTDAGANPLIRNKHNLKPIDMLPPPPPPPRRQAGPPPPPSPEQEALEAVRAILRKAEGEYMMSQNGTGKSGDVADDDDLIAEGDIASDDD